MLDRLDLTLDTPAANLACDEVLLEWAERENPDRGIVRFWESRSPFLVMGHAGKTAQEVYLEPCRRAGIPILRRITGGGTVLQGAGSWNYSLVLPMEMHPDLADLSRSNAWILRRHREALLPVLGDTVETRGISDLALGGLKISGNAQRRKRRWILFHGTVMRDLDIPLMERTLPLPPRQPDYRESRPHTEFVRNTGAEMPALREALQECWRPEGRFSDLTLEAVEELARVKYEDPAWTFRF